jgi:hypothetical protein
VFKKLKKRLRPQWVRQLGKRLRVAAKIAYLSRKHGLAPRLANPLGVSKSSDTLFILGSGASVLGYSPENWAHVRGNDSLGFNFWMYHDFVPSFYMAELPKMEIEIEHLLHNLRCREFEYENIPVFIKDIEKYSQKIADRFLDIFPARLKRKTHLLFDVEIDEETPEQFEKHLRRLDAKGVFNAASTAALPRKRASVFLAVVMGVKAGYKKIVLCGVDLNNIDYFYRPIEKQLIARGFRPLPNLQQGAVHKTNDPGAGALPISEILDIFDRAILQPRGIELYVALRSSALYPRFKSYFEEY